MMGNPLFNGYGNNTNIGNIIQQIKQFQQTFKGNPKEEIEKMLQSGRMTQAQFDELAKEANQIMQLMK